MRYTKIMMVSFATILFVLMACASKETPSPVPVGPVPEPPVGVDKIAPREAWEQVWENTTQSAKKEGRVLVYATSVAPVIKEMAGILKSKFGINLELVTGRGAEVRERLLTERKNGIFVSDVMIAGLNTIYGAVKQSGATEPIEPALILPEVLDPKAWYKGQLPWGDAERLVFLFFFYPSVMININTDIVKAEEIKSFYDLLDPKWKGKMIINDPTVTGSGFNGFSSLLYNKVVDLDYYRQLVSLQPQITRDQRLQADWIARGKNPIGWWAVPERIAEFERAGAPIANIHVKEGTYLSVDGGGLVLINRAPHPNAARVFTNWLLSREGQAIMQKDMQQHSARDDISTEGLDPTKIRRPGGSYFIGANSIEKWVLEEQDKYLEMARQLFGTLTGR